MKKKLSSENLIVALDIGTTKICVLVAQQIDNKSLDIVAMGYAQSLGISKGIVVDIAQAVHAIKQAVSEAELMAGCKIEAVNVGISGSHIQSLNSNGMVAIKKDRVREIDIALAMSAAKAIVVPEGQQILHILPQYFIIDGQHKVLDPLGMFGVRLEARTHIITGSIASVQNIIRSCNLAGLAVEDIILEPLASAAAVLSEDEKQLGVAILDIGGGTSDFAIYQQGAIRHTKVFPIAGNHITNDIALCLRTTIKDAERVKREYGQAILNSDLSEEECKIEMIHGVDFKKIKVSSLIAIIEPRVTELFLMIKEEISKQQLGSMMPAGLVLTGGGALLKNIEIVAREILDIPSRIGNPFVPELFKEVLESPIYATGYGLLLYVLKKNTKNLYNQLTSPLITRILWRMKSWVADFF